MVPAACSTATGTIKRFTFLLFQSFRGYPGKLLWSTTNGMVMGRRGEGGRSATKRVVPCFVDTTDYVWSAVSSQQSAVRYMYNCSRHFARSTCSAVRHWRFRLTIPACERLSLILNFLTNDRSMRLGLLLH